MSIKDFFQLLRQSGDPHVVTDADGEPEFVVLPYERYRRLLDAESIDRRAERTVREALREKTKDPEHWDAMMEEVTTDEEPKFQFEPVDEEGS